MNPKLTRILCTLTAIMMLCSLLSCTAKKEDKASITKDAVKTTSKSTFQTQQTVKKTTNQPQTRVDGTDAGDDSTETAEENAVSEKEAESDTGENKSYGLEKYQYDFGGRTIIFESAATNIASLLDYDDMVSDRYDTSGVYNKGYGSYLDLRYDHWREIEQKFNCKIRIKFSGDWINTSNRMKTEILAGTYSYSLCFPNAQYSLAEWVKAGLILPLDEYIDFDSIPKLNDPMVKALSSWKGKYYTISEDVPDYSHAPKIGIRNSAVLYNTDIRDREGLPDLFDVFRQGQWTWDKLTEIARIATRDYNGDGTIDQYGAAFTTPAWVTMYFMQANGVPMIEYDNGKFTHNINAPAFARTMTFISDLTNVYKVSTTQANYQNGKAYMCLGSQFDYHTYLFYNRYRIKSRFVPTPVGPDNAEGKYVTNLIKNGFYLPVTEKDPRGIAYLMLNLFWTVSDPQRPVLDYEQRIDDLKKYWRSRFWPDADVDLADLMDFWLDGIHGDRLLSNTKYDIVTNGFGDLTTQLSTLIYNKLNTMTSISSIIDSAEPVVSTIVGDYN